MFDIVVTSVNPTHTSVRDSSKGQLMVAVDSPLKDQVLLNVGDGYFMSLSNLGGNNSLKRLRDYYFTVRALNSGEAATLIVK